MGCDIHMRAEYKIDGQWEHICSVEICRSYLLFGTLVHNHPRSNTNQRGIKEARGLPRDINRWTQKCLSSDDLHTHSYLYGSEIKALMDAGDPYTWLTPYYYDFELCEEEIFSRFFRLVFAFDN
jgi:hypothetical protein